MTLGSYLHSYCIKANLIGLMVSEHLVFRHEKDWKLIAYNFSMGAEMAIVLGLHPLDYYSTFLLFKKRKFFFTIVLTSLVIVTSLFEPILENTVFIIRKTEPKSD